MMRTFFTTAVVATAAMVATAADAAVQQAQQQAQQQTQAQDQQNDQQQQVQVQVDGAGNVVVNANGKAVPVVRLSAENIAEIKDAPPEVKKKLEEARQAAERQADEIRQQVRDKTGDTKARAEEAQKAIDRLKKQIDQGQQQGLGGLGFGMQGSITIIGPDGVKHTQKFEKFGNGDGNGQMPDVQELIEKAMQAAGADLPEDVRDKLKQALKQQGNMQMQMQLPGGMKPKRDADEISRKLDRILDRLEKLEADVGELRAAKPEQE